MKLLGFLLTFFLFWFQPVNDSWKSKLDSHLLEQSRHQQSMEIIILFSKQANISAADEFSTKEEKGTYVFQTLQTTAQSSQKNIQQLLIQKNIPFKSFYIINAIYTKVDQKLLQTIAERNEVKQIQANPWSYFEAPILKNNRIQSRNNTEWGVEKINTSEVWEAGIKGQNVIIGGQDTGFEWEHPALKGKYLGWDGQVANHNFTWHDAIHQLSPLHEANTTNPCGLNSKVPCDDNNHGTYTMGIMVGDDEKGNQIGVAPEAKWIACRNMDRGYGSPATYIECFEWFLAPTDSNNENPNPLRAPHVINNSWGCPEKEGCNPANWQVMDEVVQNLKRAGIMVVVSAGNSGSSCGSVSNPPAIFEHSFSVGASNIDDEMAGFSSRGPVLVDQSGRIKPNVTAPGVNIRSAGREGSYFNASGTSAAGPHVAGAVALIISAYPNLAGRVETIETILEETAVGINSDQDCGNLSGLNVPNNTIGFGRIDVAAAVKRALEIRKEDLEVGGKGEVSIAPNPFRNEARLQFRNIVGSTEFLIFNAAGQLVQRHQWNLDDKSEKVIPTQNLAAGVYFYQIINAQSTAGGRMIKARELR